MAEKTGGSIVEDFIALQKALPVMPKNTTNPFFKSKYTPLETIVELAMPIVLKHNFAWTSLPSTNEAGQPSLKYELMHISGNSIKGEMLLLLNKPDPQGQGSAITYARRYALSSTLGLVSDEDDDGNAARRAAEAAKRETEHPQEPSRQVTDEPISKVSTDAVKHAIINSKRFKGAEDVLAFYQDTIGKPSPSTEADANKILHKLEEPFN